MKNVTPLKTQYETIFQNISKETKIIIPVCSGKIINGIQHRCGRIIRDVIFENKILFFESEIITEEQEDYLENWFGITHGFCTSCLPDLEKAKSQSHAIFSKLFS